MVGWKRPKSVDFPSVWRTFEGKKNVGEGKRKYWIQDLSEEYKEEVVEHMINNFINDEPLTRCSKIAQDPESFEGFRSLWKDVVDQNMSLICLTKDEDGVTHLAGCNVLTVAQKDDHDQVYQGRGIQIVLGILSDVSHLKDVFSEINSDTYLSALGLYVLPEYRGEGVAVELLNARRELSLAVGLKVSVTVFTSIGGQKTAEKADFKDICTYPYADLQKLNPTYVIPGIENEKTKMLRVMYKKYSE